MTIENLQLGLLDWLCYPPSAMKNLRSIENRCTNIYYQYYPARDSAYAKYDLLYPLLRTGAVEYYGQNRFGPGPSCALCNEEAILLVNIPDDICSAITGDEGQRNYPGARVYKKNRSLMQSLEKHGIPLRSFNLQDCLSKIPALHAIIQSWETSMVPDSSRFQYFQSGWTDRYDGGRPGVYRKSNTAYADRICRLPGGEWKRIPQRDDHFDAFSIAVCWAKNVNHYDSQIWYDRDLELLKITENFFPVLMERLLTIHSLLHLRHACSPDKRQYFLEHHHYVILNKIIGQ